jgi:tetratricopeptide (TPR) repeat protein
MILCAGSVLFAMGALQSDAVAENASRNQMHNNVRFQKAYRLVQEGEFKPALELLQRNMTETPDATNADYDYGWAIVCAAHLGDVDLTLRYYEVLRTKYYGWLSSGASGASRKWDDNLALARQALAVAAAPLKEDVLRRMDALDRLGHDHYVSQVKDLIRRTQNGDLIARQALQSGMAMEAMVELIATKRLTLEP